MRQRSQRSGVSCGFALWLGSYKPSRGFGSGNLYPSQVHLSLSLIKKPRVSDTDTVRYFTSLGKSAFLTRSNMSTTLGTGRSLLPDPYRYPVLDASYTYRRRSYEQTLQVLDPLSASPYTQLPPQGQHPPQVPEHLSPPYGAYPQSNEPSASQTSSNVFRFSGTRETIANSSVIDQWGRLVLVVSSTKHETNIVNGENKIVAILDWTHPCSLIDFQGQKMKTEEWLLSAEGKTYAF
jgi:hypothetical protein